MTLVSATERLQAWVLANAAAPLRPEDLSDRTPLLESGLLTSFKVMELILFLEDLTGRTIDVKQLGPGAFRDLETIRRRFVERADRKEPRA